MSVGWLNLVQLKVTYCFTARGPSFEQFSAKNENLPHGVGLYSCECAIKNGQFGHEYEGVLTNIILVFIVYWCDYPLEVH
jgi:hypothetical protein